MSVQVMARAFECSKAKGTDLVVLLAISNFARHDGTNAYPSVATLATMAHVDQRAVRRALRRLERMGEIAVELRSQGRISNRYRVVLGLNPGADTRVEDRHSNGSNPGGSTRVDGPLNPDIRCAQPGHSESPTRTFETANPGAGTSQSEGSEKRTVGSDRRRADFDVGIIRPGGA